MRLVAAVAALLMAGAALQGAELPHGLTQQSEFFEGESAKAPPDGSVGRSEAQPAASYSRGSRFVLGSGAPAKYKIRVRRPARYKVWLRLESLGSKPVQVPVAVQEQSADRIKGVLTAEPGGPAWSSLEGDLERGYAYVQVGPVKGDAAAAVDCGLVTPFLSYEPNHEDFALPQDRTERLETALTQVFLYGYIGAAFLYLLFFFLRSASVGSLATAVMVISFAANLGAIGVRAVRAGRLPLSSGWDFAMCFAFGTAAAYLVFERVQKTKLVGALATPIVCGVVLYGYTMFEDKGVHGLMPALRNPFWLTVHVLMAMIAYGGLAVSCGAAVAHLVRLWADGKPTETGLRGLIKRNLPSAAFLDGATYKIIGFSFPFLTLLIITGAVWAQTAWGRWWGWDPKETSSFVAWLIYAAYLHARLLARWKGAGTSWIAVLGFVAIIVCYVGVNYLPGLHSYGAPG